VVYALSLVRMVVVSTRRVLGTPKKRIPIPVWCQQNAHSAMIPIRSSWARSAASSARRCSMKAANASHVPINSASMSGSSLVRLQIKCTSYFRPYLRGFLFYFHVRACISRFKDCPLCGADIEGIEPDTQLQALVDHFIDGHARIKRSHAAGDAEAAEGKKKVIYEDVSMERGAFLVQQAMRVSN
jgi:hypothetical protein